MRCPTSIFFCFAGCWGHGRGENGGPGMIVGIVSRTCARPPARIRDIIARRVLAKHVS